MGARANFALIDEDGLRLHYSHWGADRVCSALAAGPAAAGRFIAAQHRCDDPARDWLNDVWAEGGALVDETTRTLWFYGGQLLLDLPFKRAFLALLELTWPDWTVRWAYDGVGDLAAAAGIDRSAVRSPDADERAMPRESDPLVEWRVHLLTVRADGETTAYPLSEEAHTAWQGPELLGMLPAGGHPRLDLEEIPVSGLHMDVAARTAGVWLGHTSRGLFPEVAALWPGWRVEFWEDRYEEQLARCGGAITVPDMDPAAALEEVLSRIARERGHDPVPGMLDLVRRHAGDGEVRLNPYFTAHHQVDSTDAEWETVLQAAANLRDRLAAET
ncbi:hypothetical protein E1293_05970 [Actinomadura darangshiensis]|uniref:Uncharacterized protein n=1 Tax=Actinomadura darangshiensis TaxID=705336 RepID=A0A4R5BSS7_9ACTN|nr:hypothetical protein [Actinomadura darangshiensis]TDD88656.1 hypothetical protein E1293_05970 [Actinomadura darangshiensis]